MCEQNRVDMPIECASKWTKISAILARDPELNFHLPLESWEGAVVPKYQ